jgi:hypothetical protein
LWFGVYGNDVYGNIVYHHGAGFRDPVSRADKEASAIHGGEKLPLIGPLAKAVNVRRKHLTVERIARESVALGDDWFKRIQADPDFFTALVG